MILRYKLDNTDHRARLDHGTEVPNSEGSRLVVRYGADIVVTHLEAQRDCELLCATPEELEELRAAGYEIPRAAEFKEPAVLSVPSAI